MSFATFAIYVRRALPAADRAIRLARGRRVAAFFGASAIVLAVSALPMIYAADSVKPAATAATSPATAPATSPATNPSWPDGWPFRVTAAAEQKSETYDLLLDHNGLAQPDGRDIRVFSPTGEPVSHFVAYADPLKARILFDGSAGPGQYAVYFGNLSAKLPPTPEVAALGRKDWQPKGGYSVTSYAEVKLLSKKDILGHKLAMESFRAAQYAAIAAIIHNPPVKPPYRYLRHEMLHGSDDEMPNGFYHVFRAEVDLPKTGEYEISLGSGAAMELGMLFLDGNLAEPIIEGSFKTPDAMMVIATTTKQNLPAGVHVFEMYTNRRTPDMRVRFPGGALRHLSGLDAHYENAASVTATPIDSGNSPLAEAYLASVREWSAQGRFAHARGLAQLSRKLFQGDAAHDKLFANEYERAGQTAYDNNWLTEGKYATRAGAVSDASLYPPLRMSGATSDNNTWDARHISSTISLEGKLIYGLPFPILLARPWGVTSAICVDDDVLYAGAKNGVMHAVYVSSGEEKWAFTGGGSCIGAPLLYRGAVYYGSMDRRLYAVDAQRGRMLWNFPVGGWVEGGACADNGRIFFGSRDGTLYAVDANLGVERWHTQIGGGIVSTPCIAGGRVYVGTRTGEFAAVDAESGRVIWTYAAGAPIVGGACATETRVAFGDQSGHVHCLDSTTGKSAWEVPAEVKGPVIAAPILVGGILYGGTDDGQLFGIDLADGIVGWEAVMPGNGSVARQPIFANDTLTFTTRTRSPVTSPDGKTTDYRGNTASFISGPGTNDLKFFPLLEPEGATPGVPEEIWQSGRHLPGLLKTNGLSAGDGPADVQLAWGDKHLYVRATIAAHDLAASGDEKNLRAGSAFSLLLDPARDGSVVYEFTVSADGKKSFELHKLVGIDAGDPKNKSFVDRMAGYEKQKQNPIAWSPDWTADVNAEGEVRAAADAPGQTESFWRVEMAIPLDSWPKAFGKPSPNGSLRINVLLSDSVVDAKGKSTIRTWALCPPTAADPLGLPARWSQATFEPKPKPAGK